MKLYKSKLHLLILAIASVVIVACSEDKIAPLENNTTPPGMVTNIKVENKPAQVVLTYTLPKDQDLLYVKAVYPLKTGKTREVRASYYSNTMLLDGFADTTPQDVKVYAVNRSEVESEPTIVRVEPLENPIHALFKTLKILPDFGGVKVTADNPDQFNVTLEVIRKDSEGKWVTLMPFIYSTQAKIDASTRGLDTLAQEFGVTVRDRFLNYSDTTYATVTPYFEELLKKTLFKELKLPTDAKVSDISLGFGGMTRIWDGDYDSNRSERLMTTQEQTTTQWITFDTGQATTLSRVKIHNYREHIPTGSQFFYRGQLRFFEIWGSSNPNLDGSWDSWTKLGTFENIKPSGLPYGENSSEDTEAGEAGFNYNFQEVVPNIRYLRIKSIENWESTTWLEMVEIDVFGDTRKKTTTY